MRKIAAILITAVLALAVATPAAMAAEPASESIRAVTSDLPAKELPAELLDRSSASLNLATSIPPAEEWNKTFGDSSGDYGRSVQQTSDGSYIIAGGTESYGSGSKDMWLIKVKAEEANKWAVVVGISDYQGTGSDLQYCDDDAREMAIALTRKYDFPRDHVLLLLDNRATASNILGTINWLAANEDENSTVVFFFSGHGYRAPDGEGWDTDVESDGYDEMIVTYDLYGLPDGFLRDKFSTFDTTKFALIFDTCYSGGMIDDNDDFQAPGRVICTASRADETSLEDSLLHNGLFSFYFVDRGILHGLAETDSPPDGVSMEEAFLFARWRTAAVAWNKYSHSQHPQIYDGFAGELIL